MRSRPAVRLLFFCLLGIARPAAAGAVICSTARLTAFITRAQNLEKDALPLGRELLLCPALTDQAAQWYAFLLHMTGEHAASLQVDAVTAPVAGGGLAAAVSAARRGDYRVLLSKIDARAPAFASDAGAQLALARVLVRKGFFARGREAYASYLRIEPADDAALTEYLYSFIWAGDQAQAEVQLKAASRWQLTPAARAAVQRGQELLARLYPNPKDAGWILPGRTEFYASDHQMRGTYRRRTAGLAYTGPLDVSAAAHRLATGLFDLTDARAGDVQMGFGFAHKSGVNGALHAGYGSLGRDHYFGDGALGLKIGPEFAAAAGYERRPLAYIIPLPEAALGMMRETLFAEVRYGTYVTLRSEVQKEHDYAAHERHTALGRLPLWLSKGGQTALALRVPLEWTHQPQPSPLYDAPLRLAALGGGLEVSRELRRRLGFTVASDYSLARASQRGGSPSEVPLALWVSTLTSELILTEGLHLEISARYIQAGHADLLPAEDKTTALTVGVSCLNNLH